MYILSINITTSVHLPIVWGEISNKVDWIFAMSFFRNVSHALNFRPHIKHSRPRDILLMPLEYIRGEAGLTAPRYWAPQLVWTHRPIGLTAPSKLDLQPHLGFAPLDLQPHPESATFSQHSSSQRNQIGPYHTNYLLRDYSLCCVIIVIYLGLAEMRGTWSHTIISWKLREFATSYNFVLC